MRRFEAKTKSEAKTPRRSEASKSLIYKVLFGGAGRSRTDLHGFAIRCITALLPRRGCAGFSHKENPVAQKREAAASLGNLERETRLELATSTLARLRSTN